MSSRIKTDARFALIPEWLLDHAELSHAAIRLYCVLDRYADADGNAYPARKTLADKLGVKSADTVDRALKELVAVGAVTVSRRYDGAGDPTSNLYVLHRYPPEGVAARMRPPSRTDQATQPHESGDGSRTVAAQNENQLNEDPLTPNADTDVVAAASSTRCPIHPDGSGTRCRACGTNPKAVIAQQRRQTEQERRTAEQQRIREDRERLEQLRAKRRSPEIDAELERVRRQLAGAR